MNRYWSLVLLGLLFASSAVGAEGPTDDKAFQEVRDVVKQIQARTVTFGATDAPLQAPQLEKDGLVQWPMVMGAIVLVVNVDGLKSNDLVLDGKTVGEFDLYASSEECDLTAYNDESLPMDFHTLRIVITGRKNPKSSGAAITYNATTITT